MKKLFSNKWILLFLAFIGFVFYRLNKGESLGDSLNPISVFIQDGKTKAENLVKESEGLSSKEKGKNSYFLFPGLVSTSSLIYAYYDVTGTPTIGFGTTHYPGGLKVNINDVRTLGECMDYFQHEFDLKYNEIRGLCPNPITVNELSALTSLAYNIGRTAFFDSTLWRLFITDQPKDVVADHFLEWDKAHVNGILQVVPGLTTRRKKERELFLS